MARGRKRGGMYDPHGSGPRFPLYQQGPPQPERHWMGPPHCDDPGQNFMHEPPPRYRMPMGRMSEPHVHAGPRPIHHPVDIQPMDCGPNNDTDLRFSQGPYANDYHSEADRPPMDSRHYPPRMYEQGLEGDREFEPVERRLPRPIDFETGPNRYRPVEHGHGHVDPHFAPTTSNFGPDRRQFGPGGHFGPMDPAFGPDSRQPGPGDHFVPMDPDFGPDTRQCGPGGHLGPMESDYGQDSRRYGPGDRFRPMEPGFAPDSRQCGPGGSFGPMESDFGPDARQRAPGDHFGGMESDFGPDTRQRGPVDHIGTMASEFGPDSRQRGPGGRFGAMELDFGPDSHQRGPGEHFGPMESDLGPDSFQHGPGGRFGPMESDFGQDSRQRGPGSRFEPVNPHFALGEDHYTRVGARLGPIDDRVRPFDPDSEMEEDNFIRDEQLLDTVAAEEESFIPVDQMLVNVGPVERTVIIGSAVDNRDFELDRQFDHASPLFPIEGGDPPLVLSAPLPGLGPSAPPSMPTPEQPPQDGTAAPGAKPKVTAKAAANAQPKPPPGRSTGVLSFIGDNNGVIERDDLKRFSFSFSVFVGNIKNLVPGVKVHFTVYKNKKKQEFATDVIIPPGGTEELDSEEFPGVLNKQDSKGGLIEATLFGKVLVLPFGKADSKWTLFMNDRVSFQVVTDLVTRAKRAANVKPQFPLTVQFTREKREMGVIMNMKEGSCSIMSENHSSLQADVRENLSEGELSVMDEVEFTALPEGAVRLLKLPAGTVTFHSSAKNREMKQMSEVNASMKSKWKPFGSEATVEKEIVEDVCSELFEGTVLRLPANDKEGANNLVFNMNKEFLLGSLQAFVEGVEKKLSFSADDVLTKATMLVGDKVQFKISTNLKTKAQRAVNVEILADTFECDHTEEQRKIGVVVGLSNIFEFGYIKYPQDPELYFKFCEVMEEKELSLLEKVEFTVVPKSTSEAGDQAIRVRRLADRVFIPAPKLEGLGTAEKEKKKMTINLLKDSVQTQHAGIKPDPEGPNIAKTEEQPVCTKNAAVVTKDATKGDLSEAKQFTKNTVTKEAMQGGVHEAKLSKTKEESGEKEKSSSQKNVSTSQDSDGRSEDHLSHQSSSKEGKQGESKDRSDRGWRGRSRSKEKSPRHKQSRSRSKERNSDRSIVQSKSKEDSGKKEKTSSNSQKNGNSSSSSRNEDRSGRSDHRSRRSSSREGRQGDNKERSDKDRSRSRSRDRSHRSRSRSRSHSRSRSRSRDRGSRADRHPSHRSSSKERRRGGSKERTNRDRRSRSKSRERSTRHKHSRSRSKERSRDRDRERNRERDRDKDRGRRKSHSPERKDEKRGKRSSSMERSSRKRSRSSSPKRKTATATAPATATSKPPLSSGSFSKNQPAPVLTSVSAKGGVARSGIVDEELARKKRELEELNELIARKRAIVALEQKKRAPVIDPKEQTGWSSQALLADKKEIPKWLPPSSLDRNQDVKLPTTPIKSILKKPKQSFLEVTSSPKDEGGTVPLKPSVSQLPTGQLFPIPVPPVRPDPPLPRQFDLTYPAHTLTSVSAHPAVLETPSAPPPFHITAHAPPQRRLSPPPQQTAPEAKSNAAVQMQRFLKMLNQGVDSGLLSAMAKQESAVIEHKHNVASPPCRELHRDEPYDPFMAADDQEYSDKDYLLPHERPVEDGSGFSRIVGMKPGLYVEDQFLKKSNVEEEENYLYGDPVAGDEHNDRYRQGLQQYKSSVPPEQSREEIMSRQTQYQEIPALAAPAGKQKDKEQTFDGIQNLINILGIELNSSDVSKLTDRTRERLYGGKTATVSSEHQKRKHSPSRHRSRTASSDSDQFRSASPDKPTKRQVFMSFRDQPQQDTEHDLHKGKKMKSLDLRGLTRTIKNAPESPTLESPESTAGSQSSTLRPDPSQAPTVPDYAYPYAGLSYAEPSYTSNPYVIDHAGMPPPPPPPSAYNPYTLGAGPTYPPPLTYPPHPPPVMPFMGIPGPGLPQPLPPLPSSSSYSPVLYTPNPSCSHSYGEPQLPATAVIPILRSQPTKNIEQISTVKPRCLKVIETTASPVKERQTASNTILIQTKPTLTEEGVKERQKKRLEQINLRLKEKNQKLMEARRAKKNESTTGNVSSEEVKNVWICGHSLVTWAEKISRQSPEVAMPLSMDPDSVRIQWKGLQGMTWEQLVPQLHQLKLNWPNPDLLIIHLGGNDINKSTSEELLSIIKSDLTSIRNIFPQCLIVWSDILPRRKWKQGVMPVEAVDRARDMINCRVHAILAELGGTAITHENIGPELYCPDGVRLSKKGIEAFNLNLEDFLEKWKNEFCPEPKSD
ncbi:hypothetical protein AALO_G00229180 [Alosa alosa]|uniref:Cold shock domain-containing protein n=1 Tax=Alosa alosa TaxID=278164 RepID=A0AAV6FYD0_9TELE|nr:uncharacterized protein LOC125311244 isoform X1 [Alosa alosa]KAG5266277.1 hypothetical protein AALO_G00229180 [Alosa alosa]